MAGRSNSSTPAGGIRIGGRYLSPARVAAIRRQNAARPAPTYAPSVQPISAAEAQRLKQAGRGSGELDPTRTATDPAIVQRLREEFGGPGTSGYNALKYAIGPDLAAYVPGTQSPLGFHPNPAMAVVGAASALPTIRGAGAVYRGAKMLQAGHGIGPAIGAAQSAMREYGPLAHAEGRVGQRLWSMTEPDYSSRVLIRTPGDRKALAGALMAGRVMRMPPIGVRTGMQNASRAFGKVYSRELYDEKKQFQAYGHAKVQKARRQQRFRTAAGAIAPFQP